MYYICNYIIINMKDIINRWAHRLKYFAVCLALYGLIALVFIDLSWFHASFLIAGILLFVAFIFIESSTDPSETYDADENGNAKPNYR